MNNKIITLLIAVSLTLFSTAAKANPIERETNYAAPMSRVDSLHQVLERLDNSTQDFKKTFDDALDRSRFNGSDYEDHMNNVVATFEDSVDRLKDEAGDPNDLDRQDLSVTFNNARAINDFLSRQKFSGDTMIAWNSVKSDLNQLASLIGKNLTWRVPTINDWKQTGYPVGQPVAMSSNVALAREVRHELLSDLPYYNVFDWIEFRVQADNTVVLNGEITSPPDTKSRAEAVVEDIPGVTGVVNQIKVLPVSPNDDRLRRRLYNEIYGFNSPLFRYAIGSRQSIHIIVENGRATLKGNVDSERDKRLAYARARSVSGLFAVNNDLRVDGNRTEMLY